MGHSNPIWVQTSANLSGDFLDRNFGHLGFNCKKFYINSSIYCATLTSEMMETLAGNQN